MPAGERTSSGNSSESRIFTSTVRITLAGLLFISLLRKTSPAVCSFSEKSLDFSGLSGMLGTLHGKQRDVSKVLLFIFEKLVENTAEFEAFDQTAILNEKGEVAEEYAVHSLSHYKTGVLLFLII